MPGAEGGPGTWPESTSSVSQAIKMVPASTISYAPGVTGLPDNVQDAITGLFNLDAESGVPSLDALDGRPCNGALGVVRLTYSDPSEVGDGPFGVNLRCLANRPVITFNPSSWDFGTYTGDAPRFFTAQNRGGVATTLGAISCTSGDCTRFTIASNTCSGTQLDVDRVCSFSVTHTPGSLPCSFFSHQATFRIATDVPSGGGSLFVRGTYQCIP